MRKNKRERQSYFNNRRRERKEFLKNFKSDKCCINCGCKEHTEILQFHHRNPDEKEFDFSCGKIGNLSLDRIKKEINKCDLLCPNCHMWLHYQESYNNVGWTGVGASLVS